MPSRNLTNVKDGTSYPEDACAFGVVEVAKRLGVSPGFIRLEIGRGALRPLRLGRRVLILQSELQRYLAAHTQDKRDTGVHHAAN